MVYQRKKTKKSDNLSALKPQCPSSISRMVNKMALNISPQRVVCSFGNNDDGGRMLECSPSIGIDASPVYISSGAMLLNLGGEGMKGNSTSKERPVENVEGTPETVRLVDGRRNEDLENRNFHEKADPQCSHQEDMDDEERRSADLKTHGDSRSVHGVNDVLKCIDEIDVVSKLDLAEARQHTLQSISVESSNLGCMEDDEELLGPSFVDDFELEEEDGCGLFVSDSVAAKTF